MPFPADEPQQRPIQGGLEPDERATYSNAVSKAIYLHFRTLNVNGKPFRLWPADA
jgi:hypothetical protein